MSLTIENESSYSLHQLLGFIGGERRQQRATCQPARGLRAPTVGFYILKLIVCKQKHILFSIKLLLMFIQ